MKILVYADVHGNLYALEELQKTEDYKTADLRVFLGDAISKGPFSNECLTKIFESGDVFVLGNHDYFCTYGYPKKKSDIEAGIKSIVFEYMGFVKSKISEENAAKLQEVKRDFWLEKYSKKIYFTHYIWDSERHMADDPDEPNPPTEKTGKLFENVQADYIFFGHNHRHSDFEMDGKKFCCVGSLGVNGVSNRGKYVMVDFTENGIQTERKYLFFDAEKLSVDTLNEGSPRAVQYSKFFEYSNPRKSEKFLSAVRDFLDNFSLNFGELETKLTKIKDSFLELFWIEKNITISFDESKLFGKSGSFSGANISFNKSRIETLFELEIDDLDDGNLEKLEDFYQNFQTKKVHTEHEQNLFDFMKKYKENGWERSFSEVGSYKTVKYELLETVLHECHHVVQDAFKECLSTQSFPVDGDTQILLFTVFFDFLLEQLKSADVKFDYQRRGNLTFPIEFDAIYSSFQLLRAIKNFYYRDDKIFGAFLSNCVTFEENFNSSQAAKQIFSDYEKLQSAFSKNFGDKYCHLSALIEKHKSTIVDEMTKRYDQMLCQAKLGKLLKPLF